MFWVTLFFLGFCAIIGYSKASIEAIFGVVTVIGVGALLISFVVTMLSRL